MKSFLLAAACLVSTTHGLMSGNASTSRYWDCNGGSCGCGFNSGSAKDRFANIHCHANSLFMAPKNNKYGARFYGSAAISKALGGDLWLGEGCGKCFKVMGKSNVSITGIPTTLILKGTNYFASNRHGFDEDEPHYGIPAPGYDDPKQTQYNSCARSEMEKGLIPPQSCGKWMIDSQDPDENCDCG